ncbi:hypothetical protein LX92_03473 [Maribacter polysiphoniae]|uniref:Uncharacterized protein n=1 Tax=Maribacter polysiphoniae TaxID=429344 RepID=A0A316DUF2_9FLAO|nr:hypothetical protein LX92_03473 [Maribacter polysiphoniae]
MQFQMASSELLLDYLQLKVGVHKSEFLLTPNICLSLFFVILMISMVWLFIQFKKVNPLFELYRLLLIFLIISIKPQRRSIITIAQVFTKAFQDANPCLLILQDSFLLY